MLDFIVNNSDLLMGGTGGGIVLYILKKYQISKYVLGLSQYATMQVKL